MDKKIGDHIDVAFSARGMIELRREIWIPLERMRGAILQRTPGGEFITSMTDESKETVGQWEREIDELEKIAIENAEAGSVHLNENGKFLVTKAVGSILYTPTNEMEFLGIEGVSDLTAYAHNETGKMLKTLVEERIEQQKGLLKETDGDKDTGTITIIRKEKEQNNEKDQTVEKAQNDKVEKQPGTLKPNFNEQSKDWRGGRDDRER